MLHFDGLEVLKSSSMSDDAELFSGDGTITFGVNVPERSCRCLISSGLRHYVTTMEAAFFSFVMPAAAGGCGTYFFTIISKVSEQ